MQTRILDRHPAVYAAAVHSLASGVAADQMVHEKTLKFPMLYDFDSEILRHYRRGPALFPLEVVIDQDGKIAHVGNNFESAVAVVDRLVKR